jgi:hypothetical protein
MKNFINNNIQNQIPYINNYQNQEQIIAQYILLKCGVNIKIISFILLFL